MPSNIIGALNLDDMSTGHLRRRERPGPAAAGAEASTVWNDPQVFPGCPEGFALAKALALAQKSRASGLHLQIGDYLHRAVGQHLAQEADAIVLVGRLRGLLQGFVGRLVNMRGAPG